MIPDGAIVSGFISKIINDLVDVTKDKIKKADSDRKAKNQSFETRIYQVMLDAINQFTYDKYRNEDVLYDAAENLLSGFKHGEKNNIAAVKFGLSSFISNIDDTECERFIKVLYHEICKENNYDVYKEIVLINQGQETKYNHEVFQRMDKKLDYLSENITEKNNGFQENDILQNKSIQQKNVKSRTQEYADKWNENMFLNNFDEWDEDAGVNIRLKDVYIDSHLPHFIWGNNKKESNNLNALLSEYIVKNNEKKMLLILGQPGIGKSTLITWIVAKYKENFKDILVYRFSSDIREINWEKDDVLKEVLSVLNIECFELENKVLILDGLDEICIDDDREKVLNQIYLELMSLNLIKRFTLIITCRENYILELQKIECKYITLQIWDKEQIQSFCKIYGEKNKCIVSKSKIDKILENKEILGTPLILYMVLALNVVLEKNSSIVDVYDRIFSLDGGSIYDRCIRNVRFAEPHRISEFKQQVHQISKEIAFWIFENNSMEEYIPQKDYEKICDSVVSDMSERSETIKHDFMIGNYFKLIKHCEGVGIGELHFVHRSIYEYFVVEYIFSSLRGIASKEEIVGKFGELLKYGILSKQILEFMRYKFRNSIFDNISSDAKMLFQIMLQDGMTYHTKVHYKNVIDREIIIFSNMLEIVHLWYNVLGKVDDKIVNYLRYNNRSNLNLKGIILKEADLCRAYLDKAFLDDADMTRAKLIRVDLNRGRLRGAILNNAQLMEADLNEADFIGAYMEKVNLNEAKLLKAELSKAILIGASLVEADLRGADLIGTRLINADLRKANLKDANLISAELNYACLVGAKVENINLSEAYLRDAIFDEMQVYLLSKKFELGGSKVYLLKEDKVVSYDEYCKRK